MLQSGPRALPGQGRAPEQARARGRGRTKGLLRAARARARAALAQAVAPAAVLLAHLAHERPCVVLRRGAAGRWAAPLAPSGATAAHPSSESRRRGAAGWIRIGLERTGTACVASGRLFSWVQLLRLHGDCTPGALLRPRCRHATSGADCAS